MGIERRRSGSMTSQAVASDCIHVPLNDTIWLKKYSR